MSILCGHCKNHHETVAEVRACAACLQPVHENDATEKQRNFVNQLREERGLPAYSSDKFLSKSAASKEIEHLVQNVPKSVAPIQVLKASERYSDIPAGYYATPSRTGNNDLDFWRVDRPDEGKWAGYMFVKRVIGGRPHQSVKNSEKFRALEGIRRFGPKKAAMLYGQTIGRCSSCNRHLTDDTSRFLGIGPDCRSKKVA